MHIGEYWYRQTYVSFPRGISNSHTDKTSCGNTEYNSNSKTYLLFKNKKTHANKDQFTNTYRQIDKINNIINIDVYILYIIFIYCDKYLTTEVLILFGNSRYRITVKFKKCLQ